VVSERAQQHPRPRRVRSAIRIQHDRRIRRHGSRQILECDVAGAGDVQLVVFGAANADRARRPSPRTIRSARSGAEM
jgi:hypothetical protein